MSRPLALAIAGSDPTGGAGFQADLKTFAALGINGASVATVLTAQTDRHFEIFPVPADFVAAQLQAVFETFRVDAIKIGMLGNAAIIRAVIGALDRYNRDRAIPVILDPVLRASNGGRGLDDDGLAVLRQGLLPLCTLVKPNIAEAALLLEDVQAKDPAQMCEQAARLEAEFNCAVLLSGGHLPGSDAVDILCKGQKISRFKLKKLEITDRHGTGCALTSAIAAGLAQGFSLTEATERGKAWLAALLQQPPLDDKGATGRYMDHLAPGIDRQVDLQGK